MNQYGGDLFKSGHSWRWFGNVQRCKWCLVYAAHVRDGKVSEDCDGK